MTSGRRHRPRLRRPHALVSLLLALTAAASVATSASAVQGPQSPAPTLTPGPPVTPASNFDLSTGTCDGTGGQGWRVQTFIVNGGVDLSTLVFEEGVASDQVGTDRDSSDGTIRSPLWKDNAPATGYIPAASPAGLINPSDLSGFDFSESGWVLTDGSYQIGYACLDDQSLIHQWWSVPVLVDADASGGAFMVLDTATTTTTSTSTTDGSTTSTTAAGGTTTTTAVGATTSTTAGSGTTSTTTKSSGVLSAQSAQGSGSSRLPATGQGLTLVGVGLVLIYLGRVAYLLGLPGRSANRR